MQRPAFCLSFAIGAALSLCSLAAGLDQSVGDRVRSLTRATVWTRTGTIAVAFDTGHPQGMVKIGGDYYVSSVEIVRPTTRYAVPRDGYDRDAGEGRGHPFKIDGAGRLLADLPLGGGTAYHPGGIDFDGRFIWVPVAEYRPDSRSIVYRVDPRMMRAEEVLRYGDHIGAIVHDTERHALHGVSWGSRRFYRWALDRDGRVTNADVPAGELGRPNPSHYIDYQDCKFLGRGEMLCGGLGRYKPGSGAPFALGGLEIVDLALNRPVHQGPVELWTERGVPMTRNPFWIEAAGDGLRLHFMPEDGRSTIYIYESATTSTRFEPPGPRRRGRTARRDAAATGPVPPAGCPPGRCRSTARRSTTCG